MRSVLKDKTTPLVTVALLTYNQRGYVAQAIDGLLSQNYQNIEIIISDDHSSDGTFELINTIVQSRQTKFPIRINRTLKNIGTLQHFFDVIDLANGSLIVVAAGDDISYPNRVSEIVENWRNSSSVSLFSNYDLISSAGLPIKRSFGEKSNSELLHKVFNENNMLDIHGASAAYDVEFVRSLNRPIGKFFFEDVFMTYMSYVHRKKTLIINKSLIAYRVHPASISNSRPRWTSLKVIEMAQRRAMMFEDNKVKLFKFMFDVTKGILDPVSEIPSLENYISKMEIKGNWIELSLIERFRILFKYDYEFMLWMFPRILGLRIFCLIRFFLK